MTLGRRAHTRCFSTCISKALPLVTLTGKLQKMLILDLPTFIGHSPGARSCAKCLTRIIYPFTFSNGPREAVGLRKWGQESSSDFLKSRGQASGRKQPGPTGCGLGACAAHGGAHPWFCGDRATCSLRFLPHKMDTFHLAAVRIKRPARTLWIVGNQKVC